VLATARYWSRFGGGTNCEPLEVIRDTRGLIAAAGGESLGRGRSEVTMLGHDQPVSR